MLTAAEVRELRSRSYNATVTAIRRVHTDLLVMRVRPDAGVPHHEAGQYTSLGLVAFEPTLDGVTDRVAGAVDPAKLILRAYSISSPILTPQGELLRAGEDDCLEFYVTLVRDDDPRVPSLTCRLFALEEGSRLYVHPRAAGRYRLPRMPRTHGVLFVASGTGEAPHNRMILELLQRRHAGRIASCVSVRHERDLGYAGVHRALESQLASYAYVTLATREPGQPGRHVQDLIADGELEAAIGFDLRPDDTHVFVCGNPAMVGATEPHVEGGVVALLRGRGFVDRGPSPNLHFETYW